MEGFHCLKFLLDQDDILCKIDLKDVYFEIPFSKRSSKYVRFKWSGNLYEFLCLSFGLEPAPKVFNKLLKFPIALLRRINIRIIVYLDDMLLMGRTLQGIMTGRDTLIFLLQNLDYVINLKKSILQPVKQLEFLGLQINTKEMTLSLSEEKMVHNIQQCQNFSVKFYWEICQGKLRRKIQFCFSNRSKYQV